MSLPAHRCPFVLLTLVTAALIAVVIPAFSISDVSHPARVAADGAIVLTLPSGPDRWIEVRGGDGPADDSVAGFAGVDRVFGSLLGPSSMGDIPWRDDGWATGLAPSDPRLGGRVYRVCVSRALFDDTIRILRPAPGWVASTPFVDVEIAVEPGGASPDDPIASARLLSPGAMTALPAPTGGTIPLTLERGMTPVLAQADTAAGDRFHAPSVVSWMPGRVSTRFDFSDPPPIESYSLPLLSPPVAADGEAVVDPGTGHETAPALAIDGSVRIAIPLATSWTPAPDERLVMAIRTDRTGHPFAVGLAAADGRALIYAVDGDGDLPLAAEGVAFSDRRDEFATGTRPGEWRRLAFAPAADAAAFFAAPPVFDRIVVVSGPGEPDPARGWIDDIRVERWERPTLVTSTDRLLLGVGSTAPGLLFTAAYGADARAVELRSDPTDRFPCEPVRTAPACRVDRVTATAPGAGRLVVAPSPGVDDGHVVVDVVAISVAFPAAGREIVADGPLEAVVRIEPADVITAAGARLAVEPCDLVGLRTVGVWEDAGGTETVFRFEHDGADIDSVQHGLRVRVVGIDSERPADFVNAVAPWTGWSDGSVLARIHRQATVIVRPVPTAPGFVFDPAGTSVVDGGHVGVGEVVRFAIAPDVDRPVRVAKWAGLGRASIDTGPASVSTIYSTVGPRTVEALGGGNDHGNSAVVRFTVHEVTALDVVDPVDDTVVPIPSTLGGSGLDHRVAVRGGGLVQVEARLDPPMPDGERAPVDLVTWTGGIPAPDHPLLRTVSLDEAARMPVTATCGGSKRTAVFWAVWAALEPASYGAWGERDSLGYTAGGEIAVTARILPPSIITDIDRPDLSGPDRTTVPGGVNYCGVPLAGGARYRWDVSRQYRSRYIEGPPLAIIDPAPICYDRAAYPDSDVVGNDDASTGDELANPYAAESTVIYGRPLEHDPGGMLSYDRPADGRNDTTGVDDDQVRWRWHFREFVRLDLGGRWRRISAFSPWRVHLALRRSNGAWEEETPPGHLQDETNEGF